MVMFTFVLGQIPLSEGKHPFDPYIDTQFAVNYTPENFDKVKIGMSINEAMNVVGEPLYKDQSYDDTLNTRYHYTGDGKLLNATKDHGQSGYGDFAWYLSALEVDRNGRIIEIDKGWCYD